MTVNYWLDSINGDNVKGDFEIGGVVGRGNRRRGIYGTSANSFSNAE